MDKIIFALTPDWFSRLEQRLKDAIYFWSLIMIFIFMAVVGYWHYQWNKWNEDVKEMIVEKYQWAKEDHETNVKQSKLYEILLQKALKDTLK